MAEQLVRNYQRLFEIHLLHHYWLDDGATVYDLIPSLERKARHLQEYDHRTFVAITPNAATSKILKGLRCFYKDTALGCVVALPKSGRLPLETVLEFFITVRSAEFYNYTALTLSARKIHVLYEAVQRKTYRYKENVPMWSNRTGASRGVGAEKKLFLSKEIPAPAANDKVESLVLDNGMLLELTGDQPGATTRQLGAVGTDLPVYVNQGDIPTIVPPQSLNGVPQRGIELAEDIPDNLFGLVRLSTTANDGDFDFLDANGNPKAIAPVFQIRFRNRSTFRRYVNKSTGAVEATEAAPLPLTYFGNAGTKQKPSSDTVKVAKNGTQITQLVSEIFM